MGITAEKKQQNPIKDLLHLVYPSICLVCDNELVRSEKHICSVCDDDLIKTSFHLFDEPTDTDKLFWGRIQFKRTYSHLYFKKNSPAQNILFNLKYKNNNLIGKYFGREMGKRLKNMSEFRTADAIIPVPLHYKKEFIRGYNQSKALADGIAEELEIEVNTRLVKRNSHSTSQTNKSRFQRWDNVHSIFSTKPSLKRYKHVILVDDVVTTGSTIEALANSILKENPDIEISLATLAIA